MVPCVSQASEGGDSIPPESDRPGVGRFHWVLIARWGTPLAGKADHSEAP